MGGWPLGNPILRAFYVLFGELFVADAMSRRLCAAVHSGNQEIFEKVVTER